MHLSYVLRRVPGLIQAPKLALEDEPEYTVDHATKTAHKTIGAGISLAESSEEWLSTHNKYRCMHGVPSLEWSAAMAANAQAWADRGTAIHA